RLPDRIDLVGWDYIVQKFSMRTRRRRSLVSSARIVDASSLSRTIRVGRVRQIGRALRKVTRALQVGRNNTFQGNRILLPNLLKIDKKEGLVFLYRPAKSEAVFISNV